MGQNGKMTIIHLAKTLDTGNQEETLSFLLFAGGEEQKNSVVWKFLSAIQQIRSLAILLVCLKIEGI